MRRRGFIGMLAGALLASRVEVFGEVAAVQAEVGLLLIADEVPAMDISVFLEREAVRLTEMMREVWIDRQREAYVSLAAGLPKPTWEMGLGNPETGLDESGRFVSCFEAR